MTRHSSTLSRGGLLGLSRIALCFGAVAFFGCAAQPAADDAASSSNAANNTVLDGRLADANAKRGRLQFLQCRACHSLEKGGPNKVGPNLYGLFGKPAGSAEGFEYSEQLAQSDIVWNARKVDEWLASPSEFLPGNRMIFAGVAAPEDRADLIAYLIEATAATD
ncbi:MAG: cytochrome c family protein [Pseudomonadota bacterium]